jgi:hypothetical protein
MKLIPKLVDKVSTSLIYIAHRLEPIYRDQFDLRLLSPIENITQSIIRMRLKDEGLAIAQEKKLPDEAKLIKGITDTMNQFLEKEYRETGNTAERAGNTKTYGLVKAKFKVNMDLPESLQVGLFKAGMVYPAYIRFGGPGPRIVPDVKDNGILSIGVKLMGVPGKKLLNDEKFTVDFSGISAPSFTTPNIAENIKLQQQIGRGTPAWYFLNPFDSHYLDMVMQGLYARLHANPLELSYYSCVPYLYGKQDKLGRAIKYAIIPRLEKSTLKTTLSDNYLREAMVDTLARQSVTFDFAIQFQTDPINMPTEDASVIWSEKESPFITVATIDIPKQVFTSPAQEAFARNLTLNPWHTLPMHRPLGNQNRARKTIYLATSKVRQDINDEQHIEPNGTEIFTESQAIPSEVVSKSPQKSSVKTQAIELEEQITE